MKCLQDIICGTRTIIGIRDYAGCPVPESNLHLNDFPGITLRNASQIANEEVISGVKMLQSQINRATRLVFQEFQNRISTYYNFNSIVETRQLTFFNDTTYSAAAKDRGLILKRWRSEVARIFVEVVYIKANASGDAVVRIIDGATTKSYTVPLQAGVVYALRTDYVAESEQVKVVMDNTSFPVFSGQISESGAGCETCGSSYDVHGFVVRGLDGDVEQNNYFGIGVMASVRCYEENILCSLLPRMYFIIWYRCAVEYFDDAVSGNSRTNPVTIFTKEQAVLDLEKYTAKYEKAFEDFVPTIRKFLSSTKGECITCNTDRNVQSTP